MPDAAAAQARRFDRRWLLGVALAAAVLLFFAFDIGRYLNLQTLKDSQAELENWRAAQPLRAALI
ncbi:MAG: hypothetical protein KJ901_24375, partial [Gammaproteobacteria bacterium]|nr:hypothetical protein [Gammaproteobacteria bacterium]